MPEGILAAPAAGFYSFLFSTKKSRNIDFPGECRQYPLIFPTGNPLFEKRQSKISARIPRPVLQGRAVYYRIRLCTTGYDCVLQGTILYYKVRLCTRRYDSVLQGTAEGAA